ncbi:hypothetical protein HK405_011153, partial [Cladochytrium tenue]
MWPNTTIVTANRDLVVTRNGEGNGGKETLFLPLPLTLMRDLVYVEVHRALAVKTFRHASAAKHVFWKAANDARGFTSAVNCAAAASPSGALPAPANGGAAAASVPRALSADSDRDAALDGLADTAADPPLADAAFEPPPAADAGLDALRSAAPAAVDDARAGDGATDARAEPAGGVGAGAFSAAGAAAAEAAPAAESPNTTAISRAAEPGESEPCTAFCEPSVPKRARTDSDA